MIENDSQELTLIDSNILVYAYEDEKSERKKIATEIISRAFKRKSRWYLSAQNIAEFASVYLTKTKGNVKKLEHALKGLIQHDCFIKVQYSAQTILEALVLSQRYAVPIWDALIAATMLENKISQIYTENTADFNIPGITAVNPFKNRSVKV